MSNSLEDKHREGGDDHATSAAYLFVDGMVAGGRVDGHTGVAPYWFGWALREAFHAGIEFQRTRYKAKR